MKVRSSNCFVCTLSYFSEKVLSNIDLQTILQSKELHNVMKLQWYNFALLFKETEEVVDNNQVLVMKENERVDELMKRLWNAAIPLSVFFKKMRMINALSPLADDLAKKW